MGSETENQQTQSIDTTSSVVTEEFESEEKLLPDANPEEQYEFATSFLKIGDYNTAERAFSEFVKTNPLINLQAMHNIGMQKHLELDNYIQMQHLHI